MEPNADLVWCMQKKDGRSWSLLENRPYLWQFCPVWHFCVTCCVFRVSVGETPTGWHSMLRGQRSQYGPSRRQDTHTHTQTYTCKYQMPFLHLVSQDKRNRQRVCKLVQEDTENLWHPTAGCECDHYFCPAVQFEHGRKVSCPQERTGRAHGTTKKRVIANKKSSGIVPLVWWLPQVVCQTERRHVIGHRLWLFPTEVAVQIKILPELLRSWKIVNGI